MAGRARPGSTCCGSGTFIAYAFAQQWFKVGGDGRNTNQMSTVFNVTRVFAERVDDRDPADPLGRLGGARR